MTCKRCGYTHDWTPGDPAGPLPEDAASKPAITWSLPDVCSRCVTPDEARIENQYSSLIENLREELQQDRFERYLLAIAQGMAANPNINIDSCRPDLFVLRAIELALGLSEAAAAEVDEGDDEDGTLTRIVVP